MRFSRLSGIAALGFAAAIVLANAIVAPAGLPPTGADISEVTGFFAANGDVVGIGSAIAPAAWVMATMFGAGVVAALRQSERDRGEAWSLIGFGGLIAQNAVFTGVVAIHLALAETAAPGDRSAAAVWASRDALFTLIGTFLCVVLVSLSIGGLRGGLIRPWHGGLGLLSATLLFGSATLTPVIIDRPGPLGLIGLVGWLMWVVWIIAYGIVLIRYDPPARAGEPA
jgi:hypothetical protein